MTAPDFAQIFRCLPGMFLVLRPDPEFTILAASDEFLQATLSTREAIIGCGLFEVFAPELPQIDGKDTIRASLQRAIVHRSADMLAVRSYQLRRPDGGGRSLQHRWSMVNRPVLSDSGEVLHIIQHVEDATERLLIGEFEQAERERLVSESAQQRMIYETALAHMPDLVYVFDLDHRFTYANEALLKMWGRTREQALGKNCLELGYEPWHAEMHSREIDEVIASRHPIRGEVPFNGSYGRRIYDYIFVPVIGPEGDVVAVAGTTRDVTERQRVELAIREQAQQLRASDRAKDEFLATLSHELRNPLAPLLSALAVLRMTGSRDPGTSAIHAMMERQVQQLVRLVDDLLELSRINRGELVLRAEQVEVSTIVRNAVETCMPLIEAARHQLQVEQPPQALWLEGDPVRLEQILTNLLNNAARYTEEAGRITVQVSTQDRQVRISVRDNGVGIAPETLPLMFEMFSRGARASGRSQGGLGIGLALARRLAQMHGGSLDATSEGPGKGSEFVLRLPLSEAADHAPAATQEPAMRQPGSPMRVLIVDDNRDILDSLGMLLSLLGCDVKAAQDGPQALVTFNSHDPVLVLLDIGMPGMNGYEVARALRSSHPHHHARLVALTGWGQDKDRQAAMDAGFDQHLVKPVSVSTLKELLGSLQADAKGVAASV